MPPTVPPPVARWGPWIALVASVGLAAVVQAGRLRGVLPDAPVPPDEADALAAWLAARAPAPDAPALSPGVWPDLAGAPDLARWARARVDLATTPPAVARGLAVHAVPVRVLRQLAPAAALDPEALAVLLDPALADRVSAACPGLDPALRAPICSPAARDRADRAVDAAVSTLLAADDDEDRLWGVELAIGLGSRGAALARTARAPSPRGRGAALVVLAWTLPPDDAEPLLAVHLDPDDPLLALAALELARLGRGGARLDAAKSAVDRPGDRALLDIAHAVAARRAPAESPPVGLVGGGL